MLGLVVEEQVEDKDTTDKKSGLPNLGVINYWLLEYSRIVRGATGTVKSGCETIQYAAGGIPRGIFTGRFEGICNRSMEGTGTATIG